MDSQSLISFKLKQQKCLQKYIVFQSKGWKELGILPRVSQTRVDEQWPISFLIELRTYYVLNEAENLTPLIPWNTSGDL